MNRDETSQRDKCQQQGEADEERRNVRFEDEVKPVQESAEKQMKCLSCQKRLENTVRCVHCGSGCYCSEECRAVHAKDHQEICEYIQQLEEIEKKKRVMSVREANLVQRRLRNKLIKLVGERPMLDCHLGNEKVVTKSKALWDTGAMVSMVSLP